MGRLVQLLASNLASAAFKLPYALSHFISSLSTACMCPAKQSDPLQDHMYILASPHAAPDHQLLSVHICVCTGMCAAGLQAAPLLVQQHG